VETADLWFNSGAVEFSEYASDGTNKCGGDFNYNGQRQDSISTLRDATWIVPITSYSIIRRAATTHTTCEWSRSSRCSTFFINSMLHQVDSVDFVEKNRGKSQEFAYRLWFPSRQEQFNFTLDTSRRDYLFLLALQRRIYGLLFRDVLFSCESCVKFSFLKTSTFLFGDNGEPFAN